MLLTYEADGREFILLEATGAPGNIVFTPAARRYVAFALPKGTNRPRAGVSVARISTRPQRRCARALTAIVTVAVTTLRWNL